jgi:Fic family protein
MQGVRGKDKSPGRYRIMQNWIGAKGCTIEEAGFIPIAPEHLLAGMGEWEKFMVDEKQLDPLVQLAIVHVEFESLHPLEDGNGRLGRMLIPLFLYKKRLLGSPNFYMSGFLESHRTVYQERLRAVSRTMHGLSGVCFSFRE